MIFEDQILQNPKDIILKNKETGEIVRYEIQDIPEEEIIQKGTVINSKNLNKITSDLNKLVKRIEIEEDTTDLVVDGLDINKDGGTWEIVFTGSKTGNIYIVPNNTELDICRNVITQTYADGGQETGGYTGIVRYNNTTAGLWLVRGVDEVANLTNGILKYKANTNLCLLNCQSGSIGVNDAYLCNMYSVCRPVDSSNITSLKFSGIIKAGATIEIYKK